MVAPGDKPAETEEEATWYCEIPKASAIQKPNILGMPHCRLPPSDSGGTGSMSGSASICSPTELPGALTVATVVSLGIRRRNPVILSVIGMVSLRGDQG